MDLYNIERIARKCEKRGLKEEAHALRRVMHVDYRPRPYRGSHVGNCDAYVAPGVDECPACYNKWAHPSAEVRVPSAHMKWARKVIEELPSQSPVDFSPVWYAKKASSIACAQKVWAMYHAGKRRSAARLLKVKYKLPLGAAYDLLEGSSQSLSGC